MNSAAMEKNKESVIEDINEENGQKAANKTKKDKKSKSSKKKGKNDALKELEQELTESKEKYLRLYAEFENYKRRTVRERLDLMKNAAQDTLSSLLPILDDFDRAKKSADDENTDEVFSEGVTLVYNKLKSTLKAKGLEEMTTDGEVFDPEYHDAITEIPAPGEDMKGKIIDTIEKGYLLNDKIIRHAKVVVGK